MNLSMHRGRTLGLAALSFAMLLAAAALLGALPAPAHALFSTELRQETLHEVKPFPVGMAVKASGGEVHSRQIDRGSLVVTVTNSDGTTRVLGADEYAISPGELPDGFKGTFNGDVSYEEGGHIVTGSFALSANEAYGAQYGDTLVFGRGLPAAQYGGKALANVTWGIEKSGCKPLWNKSALTTILDIDTVKPLTITDWFNKSTTIKTIALEQMDVSAIRTMYDIFRQDTALQTIDLTGWNTSNVTSLHSCFMECSALKEIKGIAGLNTSNVTDMGYTFAKDGALTSLAIGSWNTSKVKDMSFTFYYDTALTYLPLENWNTSSVTTLERFCSWCTSLERLDLSRWNTSSVQTLMLVFNRCYVLTTLGDLSQWNLSNCTTLKNMFDLCYKLKSIGSLKNWNTSKVETVYCTFANCYELTGVDCSKWNVSNVTDHFDFNRNAPGVTAPQW